MGKKRKTPKGFEQPQPLKSAKFDAEERFDDSEDDFYAGKDKILLDERSDTKRRQRMADQEADLQPSDEEILPYDRDEDEDQDEDQDDEDEDDLNGDLDPEQLRKRRGREDEIDDTDDSEEEVWGTNKADYYGDDAIETEEQAREEENEAKRLHLKQLTNMTDADFGFDEHEWVQDQTENRKAMSVTEKLPDAQIPDAATTAQKLDILVSRYPEFVPLAEEFVTLQETQRALEVKATQIDHDLQRGGLLDGGLSIQVKRHALNTYLATISMYFAVVSSNISEEPCAQKITAMSPLDLHEHAVIGSLARARHLWEQIEPLEHSKVVQFPVILSAAPRSRTTVSDIDQLDGKPKSSAVEQQLQGLSNSKGEAKSKKTKKGPDAKTSKKQKKRSKDEGKHKPLNIDAFMAQIQPEDDDEEESDFGDEQPLTEEQYAEKARKRKSLRFYTSQIASKANKRGHKSREAGGDDDLPHKERHRDKQERLLREAEVRGRQKPDEADDFGGNDDYEDMPGQRDENDDYYDTLLNANATKKADKQARAEAYAQAAAEGATVYEEEQIGPDGKRAITYAIAKNKGLAPKRKKEVRNPRVKKRKKYDEKMKKLGSMRQVYKGGEGRGGYGGELTGIKTNVIKSIKL